LTARETLAEMRHLMRERTELLEKLARAESAATTSGGLGDGMPRPTSVDPKVERYGLYIAELRGKLDNNARKLKMYSIDVCPMLARITDPRDAEALRLRYVEHMPASGVAKRMNYNRTAMLRIIKNAEAIWMS